MSHNTRRRMRRRGIRDPSSNVKALRLQKRNQRDHNQFIQSNEELVTVKAIDPWSDLADSLYSVPGSPFQVKRKSVSKKFTVVLKEALPTIKVKQLIQSILMMEVKNARKTKGENVD